MSSTVAPRSVPLLAFCQATRQWTPLSNLVSEAGPSSSRPKQHDPLFLATTTTSRSTPNTQTQADSSLTCLTYNVFSGPSSSSIPHLGHRIKASIAVLRRADADIIALQEVSSSYERALLRERWLRNDFAVTSLKDYFSTSTDGKSTDKNARQEDEGCILAIKKQHLGSHQGNASMLRMSGPQRKVLLSLQTASGISIATSHFESLSASTSSRHAQYQETMAYLTNLGGACILHGDFNHSSYQELAPLLGHSLDSPNMLCDVTSPGQAAGEDKFRNKPTFGELYPFFEGTRERRKPRRIDLILTKSGAGQSVQLVRSWTEGSKPIEVEKRQEPEAAKAETDQNQNEKKAKVRTKMVKLKCAEGKGGHCYPSDHIAVLATLRLIAGG